MKRILSIACICCLLLSLAAPAAAVNEQLQVSQQGLAFIADYEGFRSMAYSDGGSWYIGYGTSCGQYDYPDGITQEQAMELLKTRLSSYEVKLKAFLNTYGVTVTQNQYDALLSLSYTLSSNWMTLDYSLGRYVTGGGYTELEFVNSIGSWCHSGGRFLSGLALRRIAEAKLYLYGDYGDGASPEYVYVNFDSNGGSMESDVRYYLKGGFYEQLPRAEKSGQTFSGWFKADGAELLTGDLAQNNLTVCAAWSGGGESQLPRIVSYSDVSENDWYYSYVTDLSALSVVDGYPDGTFRPEQPATCGEMLKLVAVNAGHSEQAPVSAHWASGYLRLAEENGWVAAGEIQNLDAPVTRLLVAQIAAKALGLSKLYTTSPYSDTSDGYVLAMYRLGLMVGSQDLLGNRIFDPDSGIKRSELCTLIWRMRNEDLHEGEIKYGSTWYDIEPEVPVNAYDVEGFSKDQRGYMHYNDSSVQTAIGVDVSSHQGSIDWQQVAAAGIEFAMIRVGYRGYETGSLNLDSYYQQNLSGALAAGLKVGVYFFSQATTQEEALEEAELLLQAISGYPLQYPVVFDWETVNSSSARTKNMTRQQLTACAQAFCQRIRSAGYTPMIYFSQNVAYPLYDLSELMQNDFWLAMYSDYPAFYYNFQMWQYTSSGTVPGISTRVDLDIAMKRFA